MGDVRARVIRKQSADLKFDDTNLPFLPLESIYLSSLQYICLISGTALTPPVIRVRLVFASETFRHHNPREHREWKT